MAKKISDMPMNRQPPKAESIVIDEVQQIPEELLEEPLDDEDVKHEE
jgi:hypothetical protein